MNEQCYRQYTAILREQLVQATGCTEPVALAYAAALGQNLLGTAPEKILARVSGSIIKNAKSAVVPGTDGMKGIETALAAGAVVGHPDKKLELLAGAPPDLGMRVQSFIECCPITVELAKSDSVFYIELEMAAGGNSTQVCIAGHHTNVVWLKRNGAVLEGGEPGENEGDEGGACLLTIAGILEYAQTCQLKDVEETIERQIDCNTALSQAGLEGSWGARVGKTILARDGSADTRLRAVAAAAAGSDARMSGCELPAVINSGSGNQGLTIVLPVVEYAKALKAGREQLIRALVLANLVAIHIKQQIGYLSAYCGVVCAGCSAAAGIAYLHQADRTLIEHTILNGLAILSGTICDGAKPSCAAKIALSVEAGILGFEMARQGCRFANGDGIVKKGLERTIEQVGELGRFGMAHTNDVIIDIMMRK